MLSEDRKLAVSRLKTLKTGFFSSRLAPAVMAANDALNEETRRREREIHIITDNQLLPWTSFGRTEADDGKEKEADSVKKRAVAAAWDPSSIDDRTMVFVTLLGVSSPENITPSEVEISPKLVMTDSPSKIITRLTHTGPPRNTSAAVYLDDRELLRRSAIVDTEGSSQSAFAVPPLTPGIHAARIELPQDNLPKDNVFHFLLKVKDRLPALCVGRKDDSLFLMKAMNVSLSGTSVIDVKLITPDGLSDERLGNYSCVFLCNALPLPGREMLGIEQHVRSGGLLVIFPGDNSSVEDYRPWACMPAQPVAVRNVPTGDRKKTLRWRNPRHALLRELRLGTGGIPTVTIRRLLEFGKLEKDAQILVSAGAETPFILEREFGNGRVLFINVSADRGWSSFPLSPYYLPIVHEVVQYGAGVGGFTPYIWTARSLPLLEYLPEATRTSDLQDPESNDVSIRSTVMNNKTVLHAEGLSIPGVYTMLDDAGERRPALAVNMPREESNLTPIDSADISGITGLKNIYVATNNDDLLKQIEDHRIGKTMGEQLLWMVLVLATVEFFYANMLSRSTPKLSEALGIAASGKVKG